MIFKRVHCLFEQSGTFRDAFRKFGYPAFDYDIKNDFGCTDRVIDLFKEIDNYLVGRPNLFGSFNSDDLVIAFFPCTRFEAQIIMSFKCVTNQMKNYSLRRKVEKCLSLHNELSYYFSVFCKLVLISQIKGFKLIIENPYSDMHYLKRYFPLEPTIIDYDRSKRGDYFKKPTMYYFINCAPAFNFIFEGLNYHRIGKSDVLSHMTKDIQRKLGTDKRDVAKSMIHPDYADRFIREFILEVDYARGS